MAGIDESSWEYLIGDYPAFMTKSFKTKLGEALYRLMVMSLDEIAEVKLINMPTCDCYTLNKETVNECCKGKKVVDKCETCKDAELCMKECEYCSKYGKFIHHSELDNKEIKAVKSRFVSIGDKLKISLWLALTKMVREVEMAFDSEDAHNAPVDRQISFAMNWVLENDIERPILPIIAKLDESYKCISALRDDNGLTTELIAVIKKSLPNKRIEDPTITMLATKYVNFIKILALTSTRWLYHKRQLFSVQMFCTILDMWSDMLCDSHVLSQVKFSDVVKEYMEELSEKEKVEKAKKVAEKATEEPEETPADTPEE